MKFNGKKLSKIFDKQTIQKREQEMAAELSKKFDNKKPIFIGVLNGSFIFASDLLRNLNINCETTQFNCNYLYKTTKFIHKNLNILKNILVCCNNSQKSETLITAYLIRYAKIKIDGSISIIKSKKPTAFNRGIYYKKLLLQFENNIKYL